MFVKGKKREMKRIIGIVALAAVLVCCFAGCSDARQEKNVDLAQIMAKIAETAQMPEETVDIVSAEDLLDYYGIDAQKTESYSICINASGYQDELVMIKATSEETAKEIEGILNERLADSKEAMRNYSPEQFDILEKSHIDVSGKYVSMFVSADAATMIQVYNSFFG